MPGYECPFSKSGLFFQTCGSVPDDRQEEGEGSKPVDGRDRFGKQQRRRHQILGGA